MSRGIPTWGSGFVVGVGPACRVPATVIGPGAGVGTLVEVAPETTTAAPVTAATAGPPAPASLVPALRSTPMKGSCTKNESGPVAHSRRGSEIARKARTIAGSKCDPRAAGEFLTSPSALTSTSCRNGRR